jgi:transposase
MRRFEAIVAVRDGASITDTARRAGINRATLHRWLKAYDPAHPIASLRPKPRGPKAPRWGDDVILQVVKLIADHPDWWGKRRVARALSELGIILSEATVGRILVVARQQIAEKQRRETRREQAEQRRQARVLAQRHQRDAKRGALWHDWLEAAGALAPGLPDEERWRRIAQALARKGWRMKVKDLTPVLRDIADAYLAEIGERDIVPPSERWLVEADRFVRDVQLGLRPGLDIDDKRVGALNHLAENFGTTALPPVRTSISGGDPGENIGGRPRLPPTEP